MRERMIRGMAIKDTLKALMDARGVSGYALSERTKIPQPTIHRILTGESKDPKTDTLQPIAEFFGMSVSQLRDWPPKFGEQIPVPNIKTAPLARKAVPVITLIRAGAMKEIDYVPEVWQGDRWESPQEKLGPRGWAHVVEGDSMDDGTDKGIPEGWLIFVDPDLAPRAGNFVIAKDVSTQSATFKKLTYDGGRWYLKPLNRQYQAIEIDSPELRVIGVVTEARPPSRKLL